MVIKTTPQLLQRISIRWLPDEAYENTDTIALNVGGYFMDLRVLLGNKSLEWSRAGERRTMAGNAFQWTRIIDSLGSTQTDEAAFTALPNGDDLETGTFLKDSTPLPYEEVWRDVTDEMAGIDNSPSWIVQSSDGCVFLGKIGCVYLAMSQDEKGRYAVRREVDNGARGWTTVFESGVSHAGGLLRAADVVQVLDDVKVGRGDGEGVGGRIAVGGVDYVILGYQGC